MMRREALLNTLPNYAEDLRLTDYLKELKRLIDSKERGAMKEKVK